MELTNNERLMKQALLMRGMTEHLSSAEQEILLLAFGQINKQTAAERIGCDLTEVARKTKALRCRLENERKLVFMLSHTEQIVLAWAFGGLTSAQARHISERSQEQIRYHYRFLGGAIHMACRK